MSVSTGRWVGQAAWSLADQLAAPMLQLALTPLLFAALGDVQFGLWILLATFLVASPLVSGGTTVALLRELADFATQHRRHEAGSLIRTALGVTMVGGLVAVFVGIAIAALAPTDWRAASGSSFAAYAVLASLVLAAQELDNVFGNALKGLGRFDTAAKIELVGRLAWALALVVVATLEPSAVACVGATLFASAIKTVGKVVALRRELGGSVSLWRPELSNADHRRALLAFGRWQIVQSFSALLFLSVDRWIVGWQLGVAQLAVYSVCLQLAQIPHTLTSAALQILVPMTGRVTRARAQSNLPARSIKPILGLAAMCLALPVVLWFAAWPLLALWISPAFADQHVALARILVGAFAVLSFNIPPYFCLIGLGKIRTSSVANLAAGAGATLSMLALLPWLNSLEHYAVLRLVYGTVLLVSWWLLWRTLAVPSIARPHH